MGARVSTPVTRRSRIDPRVVAGIVKATGLIAIVTLVARIAGFARYLVFGMSVGAGAVGTAYASANLVPSVLFEVAAGGALTTMVVPLVAGLPLVDRPRKADGTSTSTVNATHVVSVIMLWSLALTGALALIVALAARPITELIFYSGMVGQASMIDVAARMLRIFALQLPLYAITIVCGAFLQARKRFLWPAVAPLISSLVVMATYAAYAVTAPAAVNVATLPPLAEAFLSWGTTGGVLAMALSVAIPAVRHGLRLRWRWVLPRSMAKRAWALAGAGVVAVAAQQGVIALILVLAARAGGTGTLPLFQYSQAVYLLPFAILMVPVMTSVFPHLSELRLVGDAHSFSTIARGSMITVVTLGAVGASALWGAALGIDSFFSAIDRSAITGVGSGTAALALGLVAYGIIMHATRILNAQLLAAQALVVGAVPWIIAAGLIIFTVLTAPTRRTPDAATLFSLCIAAGMLVGAAAAVVFLEERVLFVKDAVQVRRAMFVATAASIVSSVLTLVLSRLALPLYSGPWSSMFIGALFGMVGALLCTGVIALCDRSQARLVVAKAKNALGKFAP